MLMRMVYDDKLAQAAYLIGCQQAGEAILIDPERDVDRYIRLAESQGLRITAVTETHIHADFLSGSREMAERTGATVHLSAEGGPDWAYRWLDAKAGGGSYAHRLLRHGDTFKVGRIEFRVLHTPGHTPEHICFLVTDRGGGATEPIGLVSGDFVFVGDLGRPDLLETAAGVAGVKEESARRLRGSAVKFLELPDHVQVWPGHGAGSACGKALGAVPQSTVGYERRFNPALKAAQDEAGFVRFILADQPEPPLYFARMKQQNRDGAAVLGDLPRPRELGGRDLGGLDTPATFVLDTRRWAAFKAAHLPGALRTPLNSGFPGVAGSYVPADGSIVLIVERERVEEAVRDLVRIGLDRVVGFGTPATLDAYGAEGGKTVGTPEIEAAAVKDRKQAADTFFLDVRSAAEFRHGHIPGALNIAHTRLPAQLAQVPKGRPILVNCRSGGRSAQACALLQRHGYGVTNLAGGMDAWERAGGPVERP